MRRQCFWICIIAFLFIAGKLIVTMHHHHHTEVLYDVNSLQIYCNYVKNPISKDSIPFLFHNVLLITNISLPPFIERAFLFFASLNLFQRYFLIFLLPFPYRAPPER